jgi:hypothetical protein
MTNLFAKILLGFYLFVSTFSALAESVAGKEFDLNKSILEEANIGAKAPSTVVTLTHKAPMRWVGFISVEYKEVAQKYDLSSKSDVRELLSNQFKNHDTYNYFYVALLSCLISLAIICILLIIGKDVFTSTFQVTCILLFAVVCLLSFLVASYSAYEVMSLFTLVLVMLSLILFTLVPLSVVWAREEIITKKYISFAFIPLVGSGFSMFFFV